MTQVVPRIAARDAGAAGEGWLTAGMVKGVVDALLQQLCEKVVSDSKGCNS